MMRPQRQRRDAAKRRQASLAELASLTAAGRLRTGLRGFARVLPPTPVNGKFGQLADCDDGNSSCSYPGQRLDPGRLDVLINTATWSANAFLEDVLLGKR